MTLIHRAFTLLEFLVVMAILAILIAITMPGLARARESTRRAVCGTNLRAIGQGSAAYAAESPPSGLLERWRRRLPLWSPGDRETWNSTMRVAWESHLKLNPQVAAKQGRNPPCIFTPHCR